jgi:intein/homing endonuclease
MQSSKKNVLQDLDEAWLTEYTTEEPSYNPLDILRTQDDDDFEKKLAWLLTQPDFFSFTCKHIFNVELLPFQDVLLKELWNRKYPMYVATRGAGKTWLLSLYALLRALIIPNRKIIIAGASFRQSKFLHEYMENIWRNAPVLRDLCDGDSGPLRAPDVCKFIINNSIIQALPIGDGCVIPSTLVTYNNKFGIIKDTQFNIREVWGNNKFRSIDYFIDNGVKPTKVVRTDKGFEFEGTHNHAMRIFKDGQIIWCRCDQMEVGDNILIDRSYRWHSGDNDLSLEDCYKLGQSADMSGIFNISQDKMTQYIRGLYQSYGSNEVISISDQNLLKFMQYVFLHYGLITSAIENSLILYENNNKDLYRLLEIDTTSFLSCSGWSDSIFSIEDSECETYDIHVPDGNEYCANGFFSHNSKIRGYRAHDLIVDEFACISKDSFLQTDRGLIKLSDYLDGEAHSLMNQNGDFEYPDTIYRTPMVDVYRVKTMYGYHIDCSSIHQVLTNNGWKKCTDLTDKDYVSLGRNDYFPNDYITVDNTPLDENLGWLLGILVSEGTVTNRNYISLNNTDKKLIDSVKERIPLGWVEKYKPAYKDGRGWDCKESWSLTYSSVEYRSLLRSYGLDYNIALDKTIPSGILKSPKSVVIAFLSGLYEGDGTAFNCREEFMARLYSSSRKLVEVVQLLLLKFNILSSIQDRTTELSDNINYMLVTRGSNAIKLFDLLDVIKWKNIIPVPSNVQPRKPSIRKNGERYVVATNFCNKNKHIGTIDTEEESVIAFNKFWENRTEFIRVESVEKLPEQQVLYDFHMPETHSFIANGFIQHNSHDRAIFETVLAGFGNVAANTVESVKLQASKKKARISKLNDDSLFRDNLLVKPNQIIISGTAYYDFHFFADYWKKWKQIILSRGDMKKVGEIFKGDVPEDFDHRDYSVIRLPYELIPRGFMDDANIARSRASVHSGIFEMEYGAVFAKDSKGFFKRSLIDSCVANEHNCINLPSGRVIFDAMLSGDKTKKYIIAIDPASEVDNFAVVVIEINADHRRVVHCWTINRAAHIERVSLGLAKEDNYYSYCARKIRDLMKVFPTERIMLDSQGGGIAVMEAMHDLSLLQENEVPIWPVIDDKKYKDSDSKSGMHIIEMVNFASAEWTSEANHGLRKDMEDKILLFPKFDPIILALAAEQDKINNKNYDTLEDCVTEIEALKDELVLIEITQTSNGRDRWDTPETKTSNNKKGRMRKDRYSALIMANMGARQLRVAEDLSSLGYGGFSRKSYGKEEIKADYIGPAWFTEAVEKSYSAY